MAKKKLDIWLTIKRAIMIGTMLSVVSFGGKETIKWVATSRQLAAVEKKRELKDKQQELTNAQMQLDISKGLVEDKNDKARWLKQQVAMEFRQAPPTPSEIAMIEEVEKEAFREEKRHDKLVDLMTEKYQQPF